MKYVCKCICNMIDWGSSADFLLYCESHFLSRIDFECEIGLLNDVLIHLLVNSRSVECTT